MKYIDSPIHDAYLNMALEEYVFESLPRNDEYFMLWQNQNAIVVGKYQNTAEELDAEFVKRSGIQVVRRLSGGGAMYQDMGNLNFTFVVDQQGQKELDFGVFIQPMVKALARLGIKAEQSSRNDIVIDGKKFSGNAQYNKQGRTMHHGTLLFSSRLDVVGKALRPNAEKIASKGIQSVRSRVTNISDYLQSQISMQDFKEVLLSEMFEANSLTHYELTDEDWARVQALRDEKYATWEWVYGRSPKSSLRKQRRYPFGGVELGIVAEQGLLRGLEFTGDFFGNGDPADLAVALAGVPLREETLAEALAGVDVGFYISGMEAKDLVELILY